LKKIKEGTLEINEEDGENNEGDNPNQELRVARREEISSMQSFLKNTFYQTMDGQDGEDRNHLPTSSAEGNMEIANAYEKVIVHLYNMYCRQIFWSLI
jgi:hypothetical protein